MLVTTNDLITYMDIRFSLRQQDAAELVLTGLQSELETYLRRPIELNTFIEEYTLPSDYVGMPTSSFFYNSSLDTAYTPLTYSQPPATIPLRNSPVASVTSVQIKNYSYPPVYMGEGMLREATVTTASQVGPNVTYTAAGHKFTIGQRVTIKGALPASYSVASKPITAVTSNTFTVGEMPLSIGAMTQGGAAKATGNDYIVRRFGIELFRGFANDTVTVEYQAGLDGEEIPFFKLLILRAATREMQNMHDDVVGVKDLNTRNISPLDTGFTDRELASVKKYRRVRVA
jgi:hypothetical protein